MKYLPILLILLISCSRDDRQVCETILLPANFIFIYVDSEGNDLFLGNNSQFDKDDLRVFDTDGERIYVRDLVIHGSPLSHFASNVSVSLDKVYIQLSPEITDTISYNSIVNKEVQPCPESQVISMQRNGVEFEKDPQTQIWKIVYP